VSQICHATLLGGALFFFVFVTSVSTNQCCACKQGSIEGRRDLAGGRLSSDRRALGNSTSGQCFTSLAFSADGAFLLAGGSTKYVCMYDVEEKVMLRRFQVLFTSAWFASGMS
jgi:hypothetical protein